MKYVLLVSHGMFAPGLHSALNMLAGGGREDILSASLEDGMGSDVYAANVGKCLEAVGPDDEIIFYLAISFSSKYNCLQGIIEFLITKIRRRVWRIIQKTDITIFFSNIAI